MNYEDGMDYEKVVALWIQAHNEAEKAEDETNEIQSMAQEMEQVGT